MKECVDKLLSAYTIPKISNAFKDIYSSRKDETNHRNNIADYFAFDETYIYIYR